MIDMAEVPVAIAVLVGLLVVAGAALTAIGCLGLARLGTFYERIHAPTLGTSFGTLLTLAGSAVYFTVGGDRLAVHEVLIFLFVSITTPVTLMLLAQAALHRDRAEGNDGVPPPIDVDPT